MALECPFRSSRFPDTGRSAKPGVFEVECSEPAIRDLTHSAISCRRRRRRNFSSCGQANDRFTASNLKLAMPHSLDSVRIRPSARQGNCYWMSCSTLKRAVQPYASPKRKQPKAPKCVSRPCRYFPPTTRIIEPVLASKMPTSITIPGRRAS